MIEDAGLSKLSLVKESMNEQSLSQVVEAVVLGRATLSKIRQNLFWALGYNAIGIPIAGIFQSCQP